MHVHNAPLLHILVLCCVPLYTEGARPQPARYILLLKRQLRQFKPLVKYLCTVYELRKGPVVHRARQGLWISRGRPHRTEIFVGAEFVFCEGFPHAMRTLKGVGSRLAMA